MTTSLANAEYQIWVTAARDKCVTTATEEVPTCNIQGLSKMVKHRN